MSRSSRDAKNPPPSPLPFPRARGSLGRDQQRARAAERKGVVAVTRRLGLVIVLGLVLAACTQGAKPTTSGGPAATVAGGEKPTAGGTLIFIVNAEPPSFDGHRETTLTLLHPSASFLTNLASPWNFIYSAAKLKQDIHFYEKNVDGTGPFIYVSNTKGQDWTGKKNPDYFGKDKDGAKLPYLDGYKALIITDATAEVNAIRSKQAMIEFRGFTPQQRDDLSRALPNDLAIQEAPWICVNYVVPNTKVKPFDDPRVRQALTLAIDRYAGSDALSKTTIVKDVGGLMRPKGPFAMSDEDLNKIRGFGKDPAAAKTEAKKLLADAGVSNLSFKFLNRNITTPDAPVPVFLIDQWKQVGITATHDVKETSAYQADLRAGNFQVALDFNCDFLDEPDLQLAKFWSASGAGKGLNFAYYDDPKLDSMIDAQSRQTDPAQRVKLVGDIERYAMDEKAYQYPVLWWYRIIPYLSMVRGWKIGSNHYTNQDLTTVWLAKK